MSKTGRTLGPRAWMRAHRGWITVFVSVSAVLATSVACDPPPPPPPTIAYPDLIGLADVHDMSIDHPSGGPKELAYTHVVYNAGSGPLEVRPTYDPSTGNASAYQRFYTYDANGNAVYNSEQLTGASLFWHALHHHYHFPMASFGLYQVKADGSVGTAVAMSPKNGFCLGDDRRVDPTAPHSPPTKVHDGGVCVDPTATVGISPGWGDVYDSADPGQSVDISTVPDGTYWFRTVMDPSNYLKESDEGNNTTDVKVTISGDTVTAADPLSTGSSPVKFDTVVNAEARGPVTTQPFSVPAGDEVLAFVAADSPQNSTVNVTGGGLAWSLVTRANAQSGTAEVWRATAPTALSNITVTSTASAGFDNQLLTVRAISGSAGIGASAHASGATGTPAVTLKTKTAGSWVLGVGDDGNHGIPRTVQSGDVMLHEWDTPALSNSLWHQARAKKTGNAGVNVTLADRLPAGDPWNFASVEIKAGTATTSAVTKAAPSVTTLASGLGQTDDASLFCAFHPDPQAAAVMRSAASTPGSPIHDAHATGVTPVRASVDWTTPQGTYGGVEFGTTRKYGIESSCDPRVSSSHSQYLINLLPSTTYHYRIKSVDPHGRVAYSADQVVTTEAQPTIHTDTRVSAHGGQDVTTTPLSTSAPGDMALAFISSHGSRKRAATAAVSGGGLAWKRVSRVGKGPNAAEVWEARTLAPLASAQFSSRLSEPGAQAITIVTLQGAADISAVATASGRHGSPKVAIGTTQAGSVIFGAGAGTDGDWMMQLREPSITPARQRFVRVKGAAASWALIGVEVVPT